jgi:putative endonuclease
LENDSYLPSLRATCGIAAILLLILIPRSSLRGAKRRGNLAFCMTKQYYVYIITNKAHSVLYTGITSNLKKRVYQHKEKIVEGFTKKYNVAKLVYYQIAQNAFAAISREKQIKAGSRSKKIELINSMNPEWKDLSETL